MVLLFPLMAKKKKSSGGPGGRTRINPLTGQAEQVTGTRSGRNRAMLPQGHPLRTHDLKPAGSRKKAHEARIARNAKPQDD